MSLQKHDVIQAHDRKGLLLVVGVNRDDKGLPLHFAVMDCINRGWPDVISVEEANVKLECGDWVLVGPEKREAYFLSLGLIRSVDELPKPNRSRFTKIMERNMKYLKPILALGWDVFNPVERRIAIEDSVKRSRKGTTVSERWIGILLCKYWLAGSNSLALGPQNYRAGAMPRRAKITKLEQQGGQNSAKLITDGHAVSLKVSPILPAIRTVERLTQDYIKHPLNQSVISVSRRRNGGLPWKAITQHVNKELAKIPALTEIRLTRRQVSYLMQPAIEMDKVIRRTKGSRHANTNVRKSNGDYRDIAVRSGERYEFDGINADLFVTDEFTGAVIARLQLYLTVDVFSGMVVGVYGALGELSKGDAPRALHLAFAPKGPLLAFLGLDIPPEEWPCDGLPDMVGADNAELRAGAAEYLPELCDVGLARPYRGDDKGSVEKNGDLLQSKHLIKWGPGYTEGPKKRASDNPADKAYVNVKVVLRELVRYIVKTHNHRALPKNREIPDAFLKLGRPITPFNLWKWSVGRVGGELVPYDRNQMMPRLLPSEEATITDRGIKLSSVPLYYDLPADKDHLRIAAACPGPATKVRVFRDPLFLNMIYLAEKDRSKPMARCPLAHVSREHAARTHREMELRTQYVAELHKLANDEFEKRDNDTDDAQREAALEAAKKLKKHFGSLRVRNAVTKQLESEVVEGVQNAQLARMIADFFKTVEDSANSTESPPAASSTEPLEPAPTSAEREPVASASSASSTPSTQQNESSYV